MLKTDCAREQGGREAAFAVGAAERNARNQVVFREVNEHIAELNGGWAAGVGMSLFICECGDQECAESLEITLAEYERVRADGARFIVRAGHQAPDVERVIDGNGHFLIVETFGDAAAIACASDPRQHG